MSPHPVQIVYIIWLQNAQEHGKQYETEEEELSRRIIWEANKNYVDNHNEHSDIFGFILAMNEFADMVG